MNQKLGLHECFLNEDDPYILFDAWMAEAEKTEPNDPNAFSVATSDSSGQPDVRMVLLKGISKKGFIFYTNLDGKKGKDLKANPNIDIFLPEIVPKSLSITKDEILFCCQ